MKLVLTCLFLSVPLFGVKPDSLSGNRTTPPIIRSFSPMGFALGMKSELVIEGLNLDKTSKIFFSQPGIEGRIVSIQSLPDIEDNRKGSNGGVSTIDLGPLPAHNQVTVEIHVMPDAPVGPVNFRLQTPLGTTPMGRFVVEPAYPEVNGKEPNDNLETAVESPVPAVLTGVISKPGDVDYFKISAASGDQLILEFSAATLGSSLEPVIGILDREGKPVAEFTSDMAHSSFHHKFDTAGTFYVRIADYQSGGSPRHFYRLRIGKVPTVVNTMHPEKKPETFSTGKNTIVADAQSVPLPAIIGGKLTSPQQYFRFHARKDQKLILDVRASRSRSPLDSVLEILDTTGKPVERATVRCVLETSTTLRDHDSVMGGIRLTSPAGLQPGDLMMAGAEIMQIARMPRSPDDDTQFFALEGQRVAMLDTTTESHALDQPLYKVQIAPPGSKFPPNGLPVVHLPYRNDDGGPGYGKDSLLHFTAPADADFVVRIGDVRGFNGNEFTYALSIHEPEPDFELTVDPRNPNVPADGRIPVTVTARRIDDFDGPIKVEVRDLPPGLHASTATILPGDVRTTIILSADKDAHLSSPVPLHVIAPGFPNHSADPEDRLKLISVTPPSDVQMTAQTKQVVLSQGGKATVEVSVQRNNGFAGRIPVEVRNLPPGIEIIDVGLNGVLVNENEVRRSFTLQALPNALPLKQPIFASALVETRAAGQQNTFSSDAIELTILPKQALGAR